ncbi:hypothetical protein CBR_g17956 [Chara braunii]|uniref:HORMA domain-containing protein n=1 Tax=Chara braunii TaxID=69332 RepID=A0A388KW09_CHABU|nr:hypothetical protein CBR_g17956 [Chara braunii]|eukprot:GBG74246.1 hypothetical protein CBR_g17956 [Chara braunii]
MATAQAQAVAEISELESLQLTRNLLRIAIFNISYIRGLFPDKYFDDKFVPALGMKIKKLLPADAEARRLIDWMEKGVYDALQKKYLKTLVFGLCKQEEGPLLEDYTFSFSYPSEGASMDITHGNGKKKTKAFSSSDSEPTSAQMRSAACKLVRTLVQLMQTLESVPDERYLVMKIYYYDDVTPEDYEPPFFRCATDEEDDMTFPGERSPFRMKIGDVNSKYYAIALKVRSILDPCGDENDDEDDEGSDQQASDEESESESDHSNKQSDSEGEEGPERNNAKPKQDKVEDVQMRNSCHEEEEEEEEDQSVKAGASQEGQAPNAEKASISDDETDIEGGESKSEDSELIKSWVLKQKGVIEVTDALVDFPDIEVATVEEVFCQLASMGIIRSVGEDKYIISAISKSEAAALAKDDKRKNTTEEDVSSKDRSGVGKAQPAVKPGLAQAGSVEGLPDAPTTDEKKDAKRSAMSAPRGGKPSGPTAEMDMSTVGGLHSLGSDVTRQPSNGNDQMQCMNSQGDTDADEEGFKKPSLMPSKLRNQAGNKANQATGSTASGDRTDVPIRNRAHPAGSSSVPNRPALNLISQSCSVSGMQDSQDSVCCQSNRRRRRKASRVEDPIYQNLKKLRPEM